MIEAVCATQLLTQALEMPARKMSGFVREHADDFVRRLGVEQRASINEDVTAIHHEGIERAIAEHDDPDVLLGKSGGVQDGLRIVAQTAVDLGVANTGMPRVAASCARTVAGRRRRRRQLSR